MPQRVHNFIRSIARSPRPVIVMYHRIAKTAVDPWGLAVGPENFAAQVQLMRRQRSVLPLAEFMANARAGRLRNDALAITFDDGYLDNLTEAAPILSRAGVPSTLFLATGPTERGETYWWESLAAMVLDAPAMDACVEIGGLKRVISLGPRGREDDARAGWRAWNPRTQRERLYYDLWEQMRPLAPREMERALEALRAVFAETSDPQCRAMTVEELSALVATAAIKVEGHTMDHVDLPAHAAPFAREQIVGGMDWIRDVVGRDPVGFAYPYGRNVAESRRLVEEAGCRYACTTEHGYVGSSSDRFALPRIAAQDVPNIDWLAGPQRFRRSG